jgi:Ca2+-transporting ATPase
VTLSLAYSMGKMYNDKIVVHKLAACETMGNATTICSDKTGTLTQNLMTVVKVYLGGQLFDNQPAPDQISEPMRRLLIEGVVINSKAWISDEDRLKGLNDKKAPELWDWKEGNQTEVSLMGWLVRYSIDISMERARYPVEKAYPFDSIKKQSSVIISLDYVQPKTTEIPSEENIEEHVHQTVGRYRRYYKGAAEVIFSKCSRRVDKNGNVVILSEDDKKEIMDTILGFTKKGLRTIGFSYEDYDQLTRDDDNNLIDPEDTDTCCFLGVVGIQDPLRPESYRAVRSCQRAGVIVRMVTGDHLETAKFIARDCGILTSNYHIAMLGEDFRKLIHGGHEAQLLEIIPRLRVLARSKPEDKELLVNWLKAHGEVVAATGDGTNDAPALKAANVGLAMFIAGTAVAKSAAQVWILDDNFLSIVKSVMWGRSVYDNIRKFVQFQLTVNIVALTIALVGAISGEGTPLTAVQLLWVNLIMDTFAALALATEPPTEGLLLRRPYKLEAFIINQVMWRNMFSQAILQVVILFIMLYTDAFIPVDDGEELDKDLRHCMIFNTFVWFQLWNEINSRKVNREMNVFVGLHKSYIFLGIMAVTIGCQIILVELAGDFANTVGLNYKQWLVCIAFGACSIPVGFIQRLIPVNFEYGWKDVDPRAFEGAHFDDKRYSEHRPEDSVRQSKQIAPTTKDDKLSHDDLAYKKTDDNGVVV